MKYDNTGLWPGPNLTRTFTGIYINCENPKPESFCVEDIAHALSMQPRFGGHLPEFYSVAQHSLAVSRSVPREYALAALFHDASEAYLCDIPSPVKANMPEYKKIENRYMNAISERFGFDWPMHPCIKDADNEQLQREWHCMVLRREHIWQMDHKQAEVAFINEYNMLTNLTYSPTILRLSDF